VRAASGIPRDAAFAHGTESGAARWLSPQKMDGVTIRVVSNRNHNRTLNRNPCREKDEVTD
jgi:hypothetical protein